jgi:hypothetical protein
MELKAESQQLEAALKVLVGRQFESALVWRIGNFQIC